jgi:ADP-heptose:LPS heptosyltransferase
MKTIRSRRANHKTPIRLQQGTYWVEFTNHKATVKDDVAAVLLSRADGFYTIDHLNAAGFTAGENVLVRRNGGLGDVLMATPLLRDLHKVLGLSVYLETDPNLAQVFLGNPHVKAVNAPKEPAGGYAGILDMNHLVENLEGQGIHEHRADAFGHSVDLDISSRHTDYFITNPEIAWAKATINSTRPVIAYVWASSTDNRNWTEVKQAQIVSAIVDAGFGLVVLGHTPREVPSIPDATILNMTGQTDIRQVAALMYACDAVLSPDTGLFHLAGALDLPTVAYFGPIPVSEREAHSNLTTLVNRLPRGEAKYCGILPCRRYTCLHHFREQNGGLAPCLDVDAGQVVAALKEVISRATIKREPIATVSKKTTKAAAKTSPTEVIVPEDSGDNKYVRVGTNTKVIAVTLYRRPQRTALTLGALSKCYGLQDYTVLISCDFNPQLADQCNQVIAQAKAFQDAAKAKHVEVEVNTVRLGVDMNKVHVLQNAYGVSDFVILMEDDTPPSPDALRWFEYAAGRIQGDPQIASVTGYNRITGKTATELDPYAWETRVGFCPWMWGMWADVYADAYGLDGTRYIQATGSDANGKFDWYMQEQSKLVAYPTLARSQHAAWEDAEHTPSQEWFLQNEYNEIWADQVDLPDAPGAPWHLITTTPEYTP